jgi:hypothetical protein
MVSSAPTLRIPTVGDGSPGPPDYSSTPAAKTGFNHCAGLARSVVQFAEAVPKKVTVRDAPSMLPARSEARPPVAVNPALRLACQAPEHRSDRTARLTEVAAPDEVAKVPTLRLVPLVEFMAVARRSCLAPLSRSMAAAEGAQAISSRMRAARLQRISRLATHAPEPACRPAPGPNRRSRPALGVLTHGAVRHARAANRFASEASRVHTATTSRRPFISSASRTTAPPNAIPIRRARSRPPPGSASFLRQSA